MAYDVPGSKSAANRLPPDMLENALCVCSVDESTLDDAGSCARGSNRDHLRNPPTPDRWPAAFGSCSFCCTALLLSAFAHPSSKPSLLKMIFNGSLVNAVSSGARLFKYREWHEKYGKC